MGRLGNSKVPIFPPPYGGSPLFLCTISMFWLVFMLLSLGYGFGVMVYLRWLLQTQPSMFHRPLESPVTVSDEPLGHAVAAFQTAVFGSQTAIGTAIRSAANSAGDGFASSVTNPVDVHRSMEEYLDSPMETHYLDSDPVPYSPYSDMESSSYSNLDSDSYSGQESEPYSDLERDFTSPVSATPTTAVKPNIDSGFPDDVLQYFDRDTDHNMSSDMDIDTNSNTDKEKFAAENDAVQPDDEYPSVEEVPVEMPLPS